MNVVQETGRRARNRLERHQAFLRTAKAIVSAEGLEALTMQRIARALDCAVGTAYTYFPSKSALVAELQREAIDLVAERYMLFRERSTLEIGRSDTTAPVAALAHLVGFGRFWQATASELPDEARLLQLLLVETGGSVIAEEDIGRVLPAGLRLLGYAEAAVAAAAAAGALIPG
ncbi:MAG: TetR/AcrR family transcriptional regulator, partial [Actinomycetota bacterium]|nr:TetR/AcrR family transcriptional regulator [Actinomycetota bacterium]